jgi:hypothetical protein
VIKNTKNKINKQKNNYNIFVDPLQGERGIQEYIRGKPS